MLGASGSSIGRRVPRARFRPRLRGSHVAIQPTSTFMTAFHERVSIDQRGGRSFREGVTYINGAAPIASRVP